MFFRLIQCPSWNRSWVHQSFSKNQFYENYFCEALKIAFVRQIFTINTFIFWKDFQWVSSPAFKGFGVYFKQFLYSFSQIHMFLIYIFYLLLLFLVYSYSLMVKSFSSTKFLEETTTISTNPGFFLKHIDDAFQTRLCLLSSHV